MRDGDATIPAASGYCLGCSHPLKFVTEPACPECGRGFDPSDPRTFGESPFPMRRAVARLAKALIVVGVLMLGVEVLLSAWGVSELLVLWLLALSITPVMLAGFVLALVPALFLSRRWRTAGLAAPLVLASVLITDWPFRLLFEVHRASFDAAVSQIEASGALPNGGLQVGVYSVLSVKRTSAGNLGLQLSGGSGGGVFLVHPAPNSRFLWDNIHVPRDLGGGWWRVEQD